VLFLLTQWSILENLSICNCRTHALAASKLGAYAESSVESKPVLVLPVHTESECTEENITSHAWSIHCAVDAIVAYHGQKGHEPCHAIHPVLEVWFM
jgi:hypothetical protein